MVNIEIISTIAFFAIVSLLLIKDRKNVEFHYGLVIRRWKHGIFLIDRFVKKHEKFLHHLGTASVIIGIIGGLVGVGFLVWYNFRFERAFGFALPSVGGYQYPGPVVSVPFWYWLVGIFLIIAAHETMHAIYARMEKIPVKSYGLMFLLAFPIGAFVDPDNNKIKKLSFTKKLRIYTAGSFINIMIGLFLLLIFFASLNLGDYLMESDGIKFKSTIENTPAAAVGLSGIIEEINGVQIKNVQDLVAALDPVKPNDQLEIITTEGTFSLQTIENPNFSGEAYIGISQISNALKWKYLFSGLVSEDMISVISGWYQLLFWLTLLSIGIGIANLLPMKPFDGGLIFEEIFTKYFGNNGKLLIKVSTIFTLGLIFFNLFGISIIQNFI